MTTTMTPDLLTLLAAVDAGDDSALEPLADALEEAGDPRAPAFRGDTVRVYLRPHRHAVGWGWHKLDSKHNPRRVRWAVPDLLCAALARTMRRLCPPIPGCGTCLIYPTRHAAFLALAEALTT